MILSLETTSPRGSIWLGLSDQTTLATASWSLTRSHSEHLTVELEKLKKSFDFSRIETILVGIGPGSFTGIRVGVNCAKTLSYVFKVPVFGVTATDLMGHSEVAALSHRLIVALPAQMGRLFVAHREGQYDALSSPTVELEAAFQEAQNPGSRSQDLSLIGYDLDEVIDTWTEVYPSAEDGLRVPAHRRVGDGDWAKIQPLYLRGSGAEEHAR